MTSAVPLPGSITMPNFKAVDPGLRMSTRTHVGCVASDLHGLVQRVLAGGNKVEPFREPGLHHQTDEQQALITAAVTKESYPQRTRDVAESRRPRTIRVAREHVLVLYEPRRIHFRPYRSVKRTCMLFCAPRWGQTVTSWIADHQNWALPAPRCDGMRNAATIVNDSRR